MFGKASPVWLTMLIVFGPRFASRFVCTINTLCLTYVNSARTMPVLYQYLGALHDGHQAQTTSLLHGL